MKLLSCVLLLATPWTAAHQAPPSMGFSRQEYWSGVPLPSPIGFYLIRGYPGRRAVKSSPAKQDTQETRVRSLGLEEPLEEEMATRSSIPAWKIPWIEEPGRL